MTENLYKDVADYYAEKLAQFGQSAKGVDWNGEESQTLRFQTLCKLIDQQEKFSINDIGCGYGSLYEFLKLKYNDFSYTGIDIAEDMISAAKERYSTFENANFFVGAEPLRTQTYGLASGIFNVRLKFSESEWLKYIKETLDTLNNTSEKGFAFNCLTSYSDKEKMRDYLYYANPCELFDYCKRRYSKNVTLLHDYDLYEFTILVRKSI